mmetsp:Transcript_114824/g.245130  ORF Transcript_114824/g.245130 Transcript_114824/m.245130 type:complete len:364 (-) Transcript_114824:76-1167(-)
MACSIFRRWYCWAVMLFVFQALFLISSALLHVLYRSVVLGPERTAGAEAAVPVFRQVEHDDIVEQAKALATEPQTPVEREGEAKGAIAQKKGSATLSRKWLWKYGVGYSREGAKPTAWVMCPGRMTENQKKAFTQRPGKNIVVSLNRYIFSPTYTKPGVVPTHHWNMEADEVASGYCLRELKKAQAEFAKKAKTRTGRTVMKFEAGYGECYIVQESAINAWKMGVHFISSEAVIKLLKSLKIPPLMPFLHTVDDWVVDHPLPIVLGGSTLLQGISLAVSLTPSGSTIKLIGCSGFRESKGKKDISHEARLVREKVKTLLDSGPGWEVVNCDPRSEYVKQGAMRAVSCGESTDSEYDLEANLTR